MGLDAYTEMDAYSREYGMLQLLCIMHTHRLYCNACAHTGTTVYDIWLSQDPIAALNLADILHPQTTFSEEAVSKSPSSMILWSGRSRESVGATPSSISFRVHVNSEKP